jgi:tetratricopeptide (TPR) repeat protein
LLESRRPEEALVHCEEALRLRPGYPEALNNLGNVLRQLGRLEEAKACYQQVLRQQPKMAMTHNNLGQAYQEEGRLDEAVVCYRQALALDPRSPRFLCNAASALHAAHRDKDALAFCRRALEIQPDYAEGHHLLGLLREDQGELKEAMASYRESLRLKPDEPDVQVSMGHALAECGELEQALGCFREAIRLDSRHVGAYGSLATGLGRKMPEAELEAGLRLLQSSLSQRQQTSLRYGLAHALDGRGRYAEAAEMLRLANAHRHEILARQGNGYDPIGHAQFIDQVIARFSAGYFERVRGWGLDTEFPVYIVGLPRSGTTLTEQILASHPQMFGAGELRYAREIFESLPEILGIKELATVCIDHYTPQGVATAASQYLNRLRALAPSAERIVDKMPDNYMYLGLIATLFPKARLIHVRRDVRDVAVSLWMTDFRQIYWACDLEHISARIQQYFRIMDHWRQVLPVPMLEIDYEETVKDLEGVARRLIDWCGLSWDPACLSFHESRRPVRTASVVQVREPVHTRSVQRWRNYEAPLQPLLGRLGMTGKA